MLSKIPIGTTPETPNGENLQKSTPAQNFSTNRNYLNCYYPLLKVTEESQTTSKEGKRERRPTQAIVKENKL